MSKINEKSCATSDTNSCWEKIDFIAAEKSVKKLQKRIVKALLNMQFDKVEVLQHKLIHSFYAKALAIKIVTSNRGKYTYGIDNTLWIKPEEKFNAISKLSRRGYKPKPLKRVYIPKPDGRFRTLSIPSMKDRAMQTLYRFAIEPIAEVLGDDHSYGFRKNRSTRDALIRCFQILYSSPCPMWVLKADIKSCFDNISHKWLMDNIPMDKDILYKFIKNSFIERGKLSFTNSGIPQGGCISGVICNMALDGLEDKLINTFDSQIYFIRYADDILVISYDKNILKYSVINYLKQFLAERELSLSSDKTCIYNTDKGFDFLGWHIKGHSENINISPSRYNINSLISKITDIIKSKDGTAYDKVNMMSDVINGWLSYHKGVVSRDILCDVNYELDNYIFEATDNIIFLPIVRKLFSTL